MLGLDWEKCNLDINPGQDRLLKYVVLVGTYLIAV